MSGGCRCLRCSHGCALRLPQCISTLGPHHISSDEPLSKLHLHISLCIHIYIYTEPSSHLIRTLSEPYIIPFLGFLTAARGKTCSRAWDLRGWFPQWLSHLRQHSSSLEKWTRRSKYPIFDVFGPNNHQGHGFLEPATSNIGYSDPLGGKATQRWRKPLLVAFAWCERAETTQYLSLQCWFSPDCCAARCSKLRRFALQALGTTGNLQNANHF